MPFRLQEFTDDQVREFFRKWLTTSKHREVMNFLNENPNVREICKNPLTATILASLVIGDFDLPRSRTEVYSRKFELMLGDWDSSRKVVKRSIANPKDKFKFLSTLALHMHTKHTRRFTEQFAMRIWRSNFGNIRLSMSFSEFLIELVEVDNVVFREGDGEYSLGHLSFQEFLAANALVFKQKVRSLAEKFSDPWWHDVMVFFVGVTGDAGLFITHIFWC